MRPEEQSKLCEELLRVVENPETLASQVYNLKNSLGQITGRRVYLRVIDNDDSSAILGAADYPTE